MNIGTELLTEKREKSQLLTESSNPCIGKSTVLDEVKSELTGERWLRVRGPSQRLDWTNENGRSYPRAVWEKHLQEDSPFYRNMQGKMILGEVEHPDTGNTDLKRTSHILLDAKIEELKEGNEFEVEPGTYLIT